jgi:hypothetical protein
VEFLMNLSECFVNRSVEKLSVFGEEEEEI